MDGVVNMESSSPGNRSTTGVPDVTWRLVRIPTKTGAERDELDDLPF